MSEISAHTAPMTRPPLDSRLEHSNVLPDSAGVKLSQRVLPGLINLRGQPDAEAFVPSVAEILGGDPPLTPNTTALYADFTLCWLRPDEWLVMIPDADNVATLLAALQQIDGHTAATDVSGGYAVISLSGSQARQVLAKGCTLDLHPRQFTTGHCAQSLLAKADVLLIARGEQAFEIVVRRSFADYLWLWLVDAADEYGLAVL